MPFTKGHPFYKGAEKGWFKKGHIPWSRSQKGVTLNNGRTHFKKGNRANPKGEFKTEDVKGDKNFKWKGDNVGYSALHTWIKRNFGSADICERCDSANNVQWANKGRYDRKRQNWMKLCAKCHHKTDELSRKT